MQCLPRSMLLCWCPPVTMGPVTCKCTVSVCLLRASCCRSSAGAVLGCGHKLQHRVQRAEPAAKALRHRRRRLAQESFPHGCRTCIEIGSRLSLPVSRLTLAHRRHAPQLPAEPAEGRFTHNASQYAATTHARCATGRIWQGTWRRERQWRPRQRVADAAAPLQRGRPVAEGQLRGGRRRRRLEGPARCTLCALRQRGGIPRGRNGHAAAQGGAGRGA